MENRLSIRKLGCYIALAFGLTLFLEVACLPWVSAYAANQVEKSMVAEVDELDSEGEKTVQQFQMIAPTLLPVLFVLWKQTDSQPAKPQLAHFIPPKAKPAFIVHGSMLI